MKSKKGLTKDEVFEQAFLGCCIALLLAFVLFLMVKGFIHLNNTVVIEEVEIVGFTGTSKTIDYNSDVICEEGMEIGKYVFIRKKVIYDCLTLNSDGRCSGEGKICLVKTKDRVPKSDALYGGQE